VYQVVQALQPPQRKKTAIFDSVRAFRLKSLFRFGLRCQIRPIVLAGSSFLRVLIAGKRLFLTLLASERELGRRHFWRLSFFARPRKQGEAATVVWQVDLVLAVAGSVAVAALVVTGDVQGRHARAIYRCRVGGGGFMNPHPAMRIERLTTMQICPKRFVR